MFDLSEPSPKNCISVNLPLILEILYLLLLIFSCIRIIYDTRSAPKTLSYLLFAIFVPVVGIIFYFSVGINYRKRKMYRQKIISDNVLGLSLLEKKMIFAPSADKDNLALMDKNKRLIRFLNQNGINPVTSNNHIRILLNGEKKIPEVLEAIKNAKHHIHIEYYIIEDDSTGREIENALIEKVREGVTVRLIYDDFGSRSVRKTLLKRLELAGIETNPFNKIVFIAFANRINYRNHRKIIIVDGIIGFIGGINISDRYINRPRIRRRRRKWDQMYWRDTHMRIEGDGVSYLQFLFFCDWSFCSESSLPLTAAYFPNFESPVKYGTKQIQIAASGPDSDTSIILYSLLELINTAESELLLTTPYLIPCESLLNALVLASIGGVDVKILVPKRNDSLVINLASQSYYDELLQAGIEIYEYKKGFIHAKTVVVDGRISTIGTANMDDRSFDLNFEVNAIVFDKEVAKELRNVYFNDVKNAIKVDPKKWEDRLHIKKLLEKTVRLLSPML
jgi:cardiolipin synthase